MSGGSAFVLVHSPLVGPATWRPVAEVLEGGGRRVEVPSLASVADAQRPAWRHCLAAVERAAADLRPPLVIAGHSGAGALLPLIADALSRERVALVFVDSFLPSEEGAVPPAPPDLIDQVRPLARDGVLPAWSSWFGEDALRELVRTPELRRELEAEMPRLPLSYFYDEIPVPAGWQRLACGYLLLSPQPYGEAAESARRRGWPVERLTNAHHLSTATDPEAVARALLTLESELAA